MFYARVVGAMRKNQASASTASVPSPQSKSCYASFLAMSLAVEKTRLEAAEDPPTDSIRISNGGTWPLHCATDCVMYVMRWLGALWCVVVL